jgi:pyrroline-5-carboxylate reductase
MATAPALTLIGAGRMGQALLSGWLAGDTAPVISVVEPQPTDEIVALAKAGRIRLNADPAATATLVIAVKPQSFTALAPTLGPYITAKTLVVSIIAGIRLRQLSDALAAPKAVRAMPNTPGKIGHGVTVFSVPDGAAKSDIAAARRLLAPLGVVEGPVDEKLMAAVTALSGSGPAYVFLLAEVMALAGEAEGLPPPLARKLARLTVQGAARLMAETGEAPVDLRKAVTSPGGTTEAALDILMDEGGMAALLRKAMRAAANRDRDLARRDD